MRNILSPFQRLQWKLTLSYTLVTVVTLFVLETILIIATNQMTNQTPQFGVMISVALQDASAALAPMIQGPDPKNELQTWVNRTVAGNGIVLNNPAISPAEGLTMVTVVSRETLVAVVDASGVTLASNHAEVAPVEQALVGTLPARSAGLLQEALLAANPNQRLWYRDENQIISAASIRDNHGRVTGAVFLQVVLPSPLTLLGYSLLSTIPVSMLTAIGAGLIGTFFGALSARSVTRRLKQLSQATVAWGEGDFSPRITDPSTDEIGQLTRDLNRMADDLQTLLQTRQDLAAAEERNRMARDLHDSVKQQVFATRMNLGAVKTLWERSPVEAHSRLDAAIALVGQSQHELNALIQTLRPVQLDKKGLAAALRETAELWEQQSKIAIRCRIEDGQRLPRDREDGLYRIAQEALANAVRHSGASLIEIALDAAPGQVSLHVCDNGHGFDPAVPSDGMGLRSIRERAQALGGDFHLESGATGTRLTIRLPQPEARSAEGGPP